MFSRAWYESVRELLKMNPLPFCDDDEHPEFIRCDRTDKFSDVLKCAKCGVFRVKLDHGKYPKDSFLLGWQWLSPEGFNKLSRETWD